MRFFFFFPVGRLSLTIYVQTRKKHNIIWRKFYAGCKSLFNQFERTDKKHDAQEGSNKTILAVLASVHGLIKKSYPSSRAHCMVQQDREEH